MQLLSLYDDYEEIAVSLAPNLAVAAEVLEVFSANFWEDELAFDLLEGESSNVKHALIDNLSLPGSSLAGFFYDDDAAVRQHAHAAHAVRMSKRENVISQIDFGNNHSSWERYGVDEFESSDEFLAHEDVFGVYRSMLSAGDVRKDLLFLNLAHVLDRTPGVQIIFDRLNDDSYSGRDRSKVVIALAEGSNVRKTELNPLYFFHYRNAFSSTEKEFILERIAKREEITSRKHDRDWGQFWYAAYMILADGDEDVEIPDIYHKDLAKMMFFDS